MFIDQTQIQISSGKGGNGIVHFRREKYVPRGGPDGGDGGKGGDIILEVVSTLNTLSSLRYKTKYQAKNGSPGGKSNMTGRSGEDLVIPVPPGTMVIDESTGNTIGDLTESGQRLIAAKGGRGGRGNARFSSSVHQTPRVAERGAPGEERKLRLELKLIADVGIVGVPNAGKSTLLTAVTNAKPKIASYPFTTLEPNLGVAELDLETSIILADIPGLIEGASQGIGLGHDFLRHIQRTRVLIHLLDGTAQDPVLDLIQINSELALFDPDLADKPQLIVFNKIDLPEVMEHWEFVKKDLKKQAKHYAGENYIAPDPMAISALSRKNVRKMLFKVAELLQNTPPKETALELPLYRVESDPHDYKIDKTENGWRISGQAVERAAEMTYWEYIQSVKRFQKILETLGIDQALRDAGVKTGDTVSIGDHELEWQD
jgi:GTP-binding protein